MAIKTLLFQSSDADNQTAKVASEVAIASNLVHHNIVATYSHDICHVSDASTCELDIYKFYLIQVCSYSTVKVRVRCLWRHNQRSSRTHCFVGMIADKKVTRFAIL